MAETVATIESPSDFGDTPEGLQQLWKSEIEASNRELQKWHSSGKQVVRTYLDTRTLTSAEDRNFNLFAANTDILKAALYSRLPKPDVSRRFLDFDDDVSRVAALILERALSYEVENDPTFSSNTRNMIEDRLIPGLGVAWCRYDTEYDEVEVQITDNYLELAEDNQEPQLETVITDESTPVDYVHWKDFRWSPARTWGEVRWVGRRVFMTKDDLVDRFGEETAALVKLEDNEPLSSGSIDPKNNVMQQGEVYEIWDKTSKKVYWLSLSSPTILDSKDDPIGLPGFFPCPKPLMANTTSSNMMPQADYTLVQDQYAELNRLNNRISSLVEACKVAGVYDAEAKSLSKLLEDGRENILIPVERWAAFGQGGGLKGAMDFLPIEQIANVLIILQKARDVVKAQIYELTGISDIIRGSTNPYETAAAQTIKSQYASLRLNSMQHEVALFFSEMMQIKARLMVKFYEPERLLARCGTLNKADIQYAPAAIQLLKNEALSHFRINVSVDSLQSPNFDAEKSLRTEAIQSISTFLERAVPAAQQVPAMGPMMIALLKWGVAGYRASKDLEGILDSGLAQLQAEQAQAVSQPKPPSPEMLDMQFKQQKAQQDFELAKAEFQLKQQIAQNDFAIEQQKLQLRAEEIMLEKAKLDINTQLTSAANQAEAVLQNRALDLKATGQELQHVQALHGLEAKKQQHVIDTVVDLQTQANDTEVNEEPSN